MKTHSIRLLKQGLAAVLSLSLAFGCFADNSIFSTHAETVTEGDISNTQDALSELEKKQKELDKLIKETEGNISAEKEHSQAINEQILVIEDTLHTLAASVTDLRAEIETTEADITAKEAEVEAKKREIEEGVENYKQRLRAMYIAGEKNSYTEILVGSSDFYDMLMKMELIKRVAVHDSNELDGLVDMKEQYEKEAEALSQQKDQLEEDLGQLKQRRKQQKAQMQKLENLYKETQLTLDKLASDEATYQANREQVNREHDEFEAGLADLFAKQQALAAAAKEEEARKAQESENKQKNVVIEESQNSSSKKKEKSKNKNKNKDNSSSEAETTQEDLPKEIEGDEDPFRDEYEEPEPETVSDTGDDDAYEDQDTGSNDNNNNNTSSQSTASGSGVDPNLAYGYEPKSRFTWPVPGYYHISYGVGWRWGAYHQGIDIWSEGIRGHDIIAADAGTVILVSNTCPHDYGKDYSCGCGGGYGNYCIIDHGDGWWTLYGHSEGITVYEGQHVEKGDVIGTVGSTGYSTGPHLHFEVRINNEPQDPTIYV